jgi:small Trp-rich protein
MSDTKSATTGGIGIFGLLGCAFVVLKLAKIGAVASWSWWWVLAPFWSPWVVVAVIVILAAILGGA